MLCDKYPISDWVISREMIRPGDWIAFYCEKEKKEVKAEIIGFPEGGEETLFVCQVEGRDTADILCFLETICYKVTEHKERNCSCGAKHTFMPQHHLSYCDLFVFAPLPLEIIRK